MACVTLKRPLPLDTTFEPLDNSSGNTANTNVDNGNVGSSTRPAFPPTKRRRFNIRNKSSDETSTSSSSVFPEVELCADAIADQLRDELRRLRRRSGNNGNANGGSNNGSIDEPMDDASALRVAVQALGNHGSQTCGMAINNAKEKPVFTLRQMSLICERICKDRIEGVREEYNKILQQRLSEQYDAFVKFIDHQIHQRFEQSQHHPSYLS